MIKNNLILLLAVVITLVATNGVYAEEKKRKYGNVKTKRIKALPREVAQELEPVHELMETEKYKQALVELKAISLNDKESFIKAEIYNLYAYLYYIIGKYKTSISYYDRIINEPDAADHLKSRAIFALSQLYLSQEKYEKAEYYIKRWMGLQKQPQPDAHYTLSIIYFQQKKLQLALDQVNEAIELKEKRRNGGVGRESWYRLKMAIYYTKKDYPATVKTLHDLISHYPKPRYWVMLGGMYGELEHDIKRHAAFDVAYILGGVKTQAHYMALAYMYIGADAPYEASRVLKAGIAEKIVKKEEKPLLLLASSLYNAHEVEAALPYMERAAQASKRGEPYARLASIYLDLHKLSLAVRAGGKALKLGEVRRPDITKMVISNAYFLQKRYKDAINTLLTIKDDRTTVLADSWLLYIRAEMKRLRKIEKAGIKL